MSRAYDNMCYLVDKFAPWSDSSENGTEYNMKGGI